MSRGPQTFRKRDVTKAIEAVSAAGLTIVRVEVDKSGKIVIVLGKPGANGESGSWDDVVADLERQ
jgi:hypothetical protein